MAAPHENRAPADEAPGLAARRLAATLIDEVLRAGTALDETFERMALAAKLEPADAGLARAIATVAFRRLGTIRQVVGARLERGSPRKSGPFEPIMVAAAAQLLFLDVPDHAAVDLAIRQLHEDARSSRYASLGNAVLRRLAREREAILAGLDPLADTPDWLRQSWTDTYGPDVATAIAAAHAEEPPLDLTVKSDPDDWAAKLDGIVLPTGSVRLRGRDAVTGLPGFAEGQWWVQDAAAALPARLLGIKPGDRVADLCAAPGGKTVQLAQMGAQVVAVDRSGPRLRRLKANLERLGLSAEVATADATTFEAEPFDAVLLDAPCSATGTIRRHPDVAWSKRPEDIAKLTALQARLLDQAGRLTRPGGRLVYCTCSLEPEEGEGQVEAFLARTPGFVRAPIEPAEIGGQAEALTALGELRTLPHQLAGETPRLSGWAGFYACRLNRV
ncbi:MULTISPECIES: RsmB/NOP family class I SAM-dependent RNA methyltransferase [unclassified Bosea (in: a-proteobacteria)]|uniref:RsmB/NOP family class I SAM-dependent RNA methyltransferase n=1 Tax=unclassified Bosea (in: a-proteobacteria) TaxID=2653178 RepID=UPI000F75302C|nr:MULTISPECIES: RsmB/NOP family class I SAM-dependent RNA methyltransferase [unclassified Bosea (in: a-proteobacteria)]AZO79973.1 MFS transporter [Bosea sp. Tri-49]RXT22751.1 MFS transporter [Bosea sp. Tri-39]RXT38220.1 MFS transporter [Bosea sp. Tri-54]